MRTTLKLKERLWDLYADWVAEIHDDEYNGKDEFNELMERKQEEFINWASDNL